mmetsp:Transcript_11185/g.19692  ORF Transcript_11185/g.19692 Transcript_11185/m.19692 type:complete len:289 (+) Transcript_11185:134-1000(+)
MAEEKATCTFVDGGKVHPAQGNEHGHSHSHEHGHEHGHGEGDGHGHTHEVYEHPGNFHEREAPKRVGEGRDSYEQRAFTIGIAGPVGAGKSHLMLELCRHFVASGHPNIGAITNDILTKEDQEFLIRENALEAERILAIETGSCPHASIREDISQNMLACEALTSKFKPELILLEAGGDNLAASFSRELADYIIYVIDVAGGTKIPRKGGPGITQSDLLVINKTDLAEAVGSDLVVMEKDAIRMRGEGPILMCQVKHRKGVPEVAEMILQAVKSQKQLCAKKNKQDEA